MSAQIITFPSMGPAEPVATAEQAGTVGFEPIPENTIALLRRELADTWRETGEIDRLMAVEEMFKNAEKRLLGWARVAGAAHIRQLIAISAAVFDEAGADTDPPACAA